jgi:MFS family permease
LGGRESARQSHGGDLFYGWYIVAASFIVCFIVYGIAINTFTVYVKPLEAEFGWTRKAISAAISLGALSMALSAPLIGRLIDRLGARRMMVIGSLMAATSMALLHWMNSITYYYGMFVIAGIGQAAATLIPISLVIANWFNVKRGLAMGIVASGTGLGAMVMVPITTVVVTHWGWRTSFLAMGLTIGLVAVPVIALYIRTKPAELGLQPDGAPAHDVQQARLATVGLSLAEALRTRTFWLIAALMSIFAHVALGLWVHMMAYLSDLGYAEATASLIVAVISAMTVAGKLVMGLVSDRWGPQWAVVLTSGLTIGGIVLLIVAKPLSFAILFAVLYGFANGAPMVFNPTLTSKQLGLAHFGAIFGMLNLLSTLAAALGPVVSGAIYDSFKTYVPAYVLFMVLVALAGVCGLKTRPEVHQ